MEDEGGKTQPTHPPTIGLLAGHCQDQEALKKGVKFLIERQQMDGDWAQEGITGVFNRNCGITYSQYRNVFPIWALGRYAKEVEEEEERSGWVR